MRRTLTVRMLLLIVGTGVGLGYIALGNIRNAAAKSSCKNNLRSLVIGLHNYASSNDDFLPRATLGSDGLPPEQRLSWIFELDPFIHARMDPDWTIHRNEPWNSEHNRRFAQQRMMWMQCPSAPKSTTPEGYTLSTYVGMTGVGNDAAMLPKEDRRAGVFGYERKLKLTRIADLSQNTIVVMETSTDNGPWMAGGRPTSRPFDNDSTLAIGPGGQFGGFHYDGANVCYADGSVRFIGDSIDRETLSALITIAGGEQVQAVGD